MAAKLDADAGRGRFPWRAAPWLGAALLMGLPLGAAALTDEMAWSAADFVIFGVVLLAACGGFELAARGTASPAYRAATALALAAGFLLVWINLAVGIVGSEGHPANLMFAGVLAVGLGGAMFGRFRPAAMARALAATALAQALAALVAVSAGWGAEGANWPAALLVLTGFFVALWLLSAGLFRRAAREGRAGPGGP